MSAKRGKLNLIDVQKSREKWLTWKDVAPLRERLDALDEISVKYNLGDIVEISLDASIKQLQEIENFAKALSPWRKGPFKISDIFIDSEWQSFMKYNLLEPYIDLKDKVVADIGCNNGYYMFRMLCQNPKKIVGFDPSPLYKTQFDFINHFIKSDIIFEMLGVEHLDIYNRKFDIIFCLGVLYHRSDPIKTLKSLKKGLSTGGVLYLDTFMIDGEEEICLTPQKTYSKIPNIYFIPTLPALRNWCKRAGFKKIEVLEIKQTDLNEQRRTDWAKGESLNNFLDPSNPLKTVEGYPAPKRVYIKGYL